MRSASELRAERQRLEALVVQLEKTWQARRHGASACESPALVMKTRSCAALRVMSAP
jgi:hypothetical protein